MKKSLRELLKKGYIEMAAEAKAVTHAFRILDREALKYVDGPPRPLGLVR